jgi:hypothetical protein
VANLQAVSADVAEPKDVCLQGGRPGAGASVVLLLHCDLPTLLLPQQDSAGSNSLLSSQMTLVTPVLSPGRAAADTAARRVGHLHRRRLPHCQRQQRHARVAGPRHVAAAAHRGRARWRRHGALGQRGEHRQAVLRRQHPAGRCRALRTCLWQVKQCLSLAGQDVIWSAPCLHFVGCR